jgi:aminopeptidase N
MKSVLAQQKRIDNHIALARGAAYCHEIYMADNRQQNLSADAAIEPQAPAVIYRKDYTPPPWRIDTVDMDFRLGLAETKVTAKLSLVKNDHKQEGPEGPEGHDAPLALDVDNVLPDSISQNGAALSWRVEGNKIIVEGAQDGAVLHIACTIKPDQNSALMGIFASNGMLCSQCEAEGFRRIIPFIDRPDNMSIYTVRMQGDKAAFPVLLSNGELTDSGDCGDGQHYAVWHDPWRKPSYLFALVAGDLVANTDSFTTMSGKAVDLAIYTRSAEDSARTGHAMKALKDSMRWDEQVYGREYDLGVFNIVAVSDFNMGAMENKGLNVFNTRYILADQDTANDNDFDGVEGVVAHEYFHNWSGNRVTCRDWFQLSLKEGFTVYRDQCFSADMNSAPVKRIEDVRILRAAQFPEDAGPLAHPIRPDSYMEISNFYTATVYNKGAEIIRMIASLAEQAGAGNFRKGTDLYFDRHDGEAATCEDFVAAIEEGAGLDLSHFRLWYSQAGTPQIHTDMAFDADSGTVTLMLKQSMAATPGQSEKQPMLIPLKTALIDGVTGEKRAEDLLVMEQAEQSFTFTGFDTAPILSINRGFSAPVTVHSPSDPAGLAHLVRHDDDSFARYEALQKLVTERILAGVAGTDETAIADADLVALFASLLDDDRLEEAMRAELLTLPGESFVAEQQAVMQPLLVHAERQKLRVLLGRELADKWRASYQAMAAVPFSLDGTAKGARRMKGLALAYLVAGGADDAAQLCYDQFVAADNMTDRQSALMSLASLDDPLREQALGEFYDRYQGNALVIDKWFSMQALSMHPDCMAHIKKLQDHPDFTLSNPNRVRALYGALAGNSAVFHDESGEGYAMLTDMIIALDAKNPQTAARFIPPLGRWRRYDETRAAQMKAALERIRDVDGLSKDTTEQVVKSLG